MTLLDTDDDTLRDRMERSPELLLREIRELQAIRDRARSVARHPNGDLHHGIGAVRAAHYALTGYWMPSRY